MTFFPTEQDIDRVERALGQQIAQGDALREEIRELARAGDIEVEGKLEQLRAEVQTADHALDLRLAETASVLTEHFEKRCRAQADEASRLVDALRFETGAVDGELRTIGQLHAALIEEVKGDNRCLKAEIVDIDARLTGLIGDARADTASVVDQLGTLQHHHATLIEERREEALRLGGEIATFAPRFIALEDRGAQSSSILAEIDGRVDVQGRELLRTIEEAEAALLVRVQQTEGALDAARREIQALDASIGRARVRTARILGAGAIVAAVAIAAARLL